MYDIISNEIAPGVRFSKVRVDRFKNIRICVTALLPLERETVSSYALLSQVLTRSCEAYPDFTLLSKKLSSLYGASLEGGIRKMGESIGISFNVTGIDDRYAIKGESVAGELSELLCKIIFEPKLVDGNFDKDEIEQERRQLIDLCDAELSDKRVYAGNRLLEVMCEHEAFGIRRYGDREHISAVTPEMLKNAWETMIKTAQFEIFYTGDSAPDTAVRVFTEKFMNVEREVCTLHTEIVRKADKVREVTDIMEVSQAKLLMGFRTDCASGEPDVTAMRLMCAILGSGANSKFFKNIREAQSLCYFCFSRFQRAKGIITVESGVDFENIEKTKNAVLNELKAMQTGDISEDEINFAKLSVANDFVSLTDVLSGIAEWYLSQLGDERFLTVEEAIADFSKVTKEELVACANKLTLDTVYVLRG